jgi:hypothetical protein
MMNDKRKKLITIAAIGITGLVVASGFVSCSQTHNENTKDSSSDIAQLLDHSAQSTSTTLGGTTTSTVPNGRPAITPDVVKNKLNEIPLTSHIDFNYPELYTSARWDAIINNTLSLGDDDDIENTYLYDNIALTELDDPSNSDLDQLTFTQLRNLGINVAKANATGINAKSYADYLSGTDIDSCRDFTVDAAGAISMPYENDDSWALSIVYWHAQCGPYGNGDTVHNTSTNQEIFLHRIKGTWIPVQASALPRNE